MKIFRMQRDNFLKKNKMGSYLAYAFGEIILVVIGILIAVSLNNWNEKRKSQLELDTILATISDELKLDVQQIDSIVGIYEEKQPLYVKVVNDQVTKEDYLKTRAYNHLIFGFPELTITTRGYELLKNFNSNSGKQNDSLVEKAIHLYTEMLHQVKADDKLRTTDFNENLFFWKNNFDWWADYVIGFKLNGFIDYALTDQDYKNRVANNYLICYYAFLPDLNKFKRAAIELIEYIDSSMQN